MSYSELYKLISSPWCSTNDIKLIARCGRDTTIKIRKEIEKGIEKNGKSLPPVLRQYVSQHKKLSNILD